MLYHTCLLLIFCEEKQEDSVSYTMYADTVQFLLMIHFWSMGMDSVISHLIVVDIL